MEKPRTHEQAQSPKFSLNSARGRIAAVIIGLAGVTALPATLQACKISLSGSAELNVANKAKKEAVKDGTSVIVVANPGAVIVLGLKEVDGGTQIEGRMDISETSLLHRLSHEVREYTLPSDAKQPFVRMVVEPTGRVSIWTKDNGVAVAFECGNLQLLTANDTGSDAGADAGSPAQKAVSFCIGYDVNPKELEKKIADDKQAAFDKLIKDAELATWQRKEADRKKAEAEAEANKPKEAGSETTKVGKDAGTDADADTTTDASPDSNTDAGTEAGSNISKETATNARQEIRSLLNSASLAKVRSTARMISVPPYNEIDSGSKNQVTDLIFDYLSSHFENNDYETIMVVLRYLRGSVTKEDQDHIQKMYGHGIPN